MDRSNVCAIVSARVDADPQPLLSHATQTIACDHICFTDMFSVPLIQSARESMTCLFDASIYCRGLDYFGDYQGKKLEKEDNRKHVDNICNNTTTTTNDGTETAARKPRRPKSKLPLEEEEFDVESLQDFSPDMKALQYEFIRTNLYRLPELRRYRYVIWVEPDASIQDPRFVEMCVYSGEHVIAKDQDRVIFYDIRSPQVQTMLLSRWTTSNMS